MGWLLGRKPRLCDVQERQMVLPNTRKVVFFAPHTSERMATWPLVSELSGRLRQAGIACETHVIEDMKDSVISMSVKMSRLKLSKENRTVLEHLYRLKDATVRLALLCRIMEGKPDAFVLEMHALDGDYGSRDRFDSAPRFYRLPDTRILYLRDYLGEYALPIGTGQRLLETMDGKGLREAAAILSLEKTRIREETPGQLRFLAQNLQRAMLIRIPAPCVDGHEDIRSLTAFERAYGLSSSNHHTLAESDVDALAAALG